MRPYAEPPGRAAALGPVLAVLRRTGFERIAEVPAVPADGRGRMRYPVRTEVARAEGAGDRPPPLEDWYLRSFGTRFDLLLRHWPRRGTTRCYSLGWGLSGPDQVPDLLLVQALDDRDTLRALARELTRSVPGRARWDWDIGDFHGRPCLRAAAVGAPPAGGGGAHA
ncbi:hypothetical protein ACF07L_05900 [Streptomyces anulatus]|uniref:hypothetical protein n=1 Tax=Streptomyces anulatus TaxID=1892 RepID=UPI0036FAC7B1